MNTQEIFGLMVDRKATHLHLVPGSPIMVRADSQFAPLDGAVLGPQDTEKIMMGLMNEAQKRDFEVKREIDFTYSVPGLSRFRINVFRQRGSVAAVIKMNPQAPPNIEELGLPDILKNTVLTIRSGLILISGPKGSGKSTTLAALINHILSNRVCQIVTLENPIDFLFKNQKGAVCQRELGTDFLTYEDAFRSYTHQAGDILVVTEMISYDVVSSVLSLAAAGNLVIATMTAPGMQLMIDHMVDLFPPHLSQQARTWLGTGLEVAVVQTLCDKLAGGKAAAYEVLVGTTQVKNYIKDGKIIQLQTLMGTGRDVGMSTQEGALRGLVRKNVISQEEATARAVRSEEFKKLMSMPI